MVKVSRYLGDAKSADDTLMTAFGNWMFTTAVNILFNAKYTMYWVFTMQSKKKFSSKRVLKEYLQ